MKNATATQAKLISNFFATPFVTPAPVAVDIIDDAVDADDDTDDADNAADDDAVAEPVVEAAPVAPPAFWSRGTRFKPKAGFETVLYAALDEILTADEVVAKLLASGEYQRVAPKAAANRPMRPANFLLKDWVTRGILARTA
jgi:hypothetical protein